MEDGVTEGERRRAEKIGRAEWGDGRVEKKKMQRKKIKGRGERITEKRKKRSYKKENTRLEKKKNKNQAK